MRKIAIAIGVVLLVGSCQQGNEKNTSPVEKAVASTTTPTTEIDSKAEQMVKKTITAHGGALYDQASYSFVFRKNNYHFTNDGPSYRYEVQSKDKKGNLIKDVIVNGDFTRFINKKEVVLSELDIAKYKGALNSVIYFATLPHKLSDAAVNRSYQGTTTIKGEDYEVIKIYFDEKGGGEDHDDTYFYWINTQTHKVDYLAYNYTVNGGGARFRSFYNRRIVDGITFQDYINWKAPKDAALASLPQLFENNQLKELSKIETEQIKHIK